MANKLIVLLSSLFLLAIIGFRYHQYIVDQNFLLYLNGPCDPANESCFIEDCSAGDESCQAVPYIKIELLAKDAPNCLEEHTCESFSCEGLNQCEITYCSEDALEEGEVCAPLGLNNLENEKN